MLITLVMNIAFVVLLAILISLLIKNAGRNLTAARFVLATLLLAPTVLFITKLLIAPISAPDMRHFGGACVEQIPLIAIMLAAGLPGLLYARRRSFGFFVSFLVIGGVLTVLLTLGTIVQREIVEAVQEFSAYFSIAVFLGTWTHTLRQNRACAASR